MVKRLIYLLRVSTLLFSTAIVNAADKSFIDWQSTNFQLLHGYDYKLGNSERTIFTFEHTNGWKYGDFYIFADQIRLSDEKHVYYFEPTLRLSLNKVTGQSFSTNFIKDILISAQMEKPEGQDERWLAGAAIDFNLSGFKFFKVNLFVRDNPKLMGRTHQLTFAWNRLIKIGGVKLLLEGFADFAGSEGSTASNQLIVPRLLLDIGDLSGIVENKLWIGLEWQYWHNKFGVRGVTESVPQLQIKYIL